MTVAKKTATKSAAKKTKSPVKAKATTAKKVSLKSSATVKPKKATSKTATVKKTAKPKATTTRKTAAAKAPAKPRARTKAKAATQHKATSAAKPKGYAKAKAQVASGINDFTEIEKVELLDWVGKIDMLHKRDQDGLKGLAKIDAILDKYNQRFKAMTEKFEAIVKLGLEKDPRVEHEHVYVLMNNRDKDVLELFELLAKIGKGEVKYAEAKQQMMNIYKEAASQRFAKR